MFFSVRLIIVVPLDTVSDFHIHRLLDNIFQGMVGISTKNINELIPKTSQNIARIAKTDLHKLPGNSSLNVRSVCSLWLVSHVCPVILVDNHDDHADSEDHDDHYDHHYNDDQYHDDPDDHDVHGDTNEKYKIVFQVLMVGLDDLLALRNIDRVKVKQLFNPNFKYLKSLKTNSHYKHQVSWVPVTAETNSA